jgi:hypothetical protein
MTDSTVLEKHKPNTVTDNTAVNSSVSNVSDICIVSSSTSKTIKTNNSTKDCVHKMVPS